MTVLVSAVLRAACGCRRGRACRQRCRTVHAAGRTDGSPAWIVRSMPLTMKSRASPCGNRSIDMHRWSPGRRACGQAKCECGRMRRRRRDFSHDGTRGRQDRKCGWNSVPMLPIVDRQWKRQNYPLFQPPAALAKAMNFGSNRTAPNHMHWLRAPSTRLEVNEGHRAIPKHLKQTDIIIVSHCRHVPGKARIWPTHLLM